MRALSRSSRTARDWHRPLGMRKLSCWAARIALSAGATAGIVAACYNDVPDPVTPLPPREVPPQGPRPGPIQPLPLPTADAGPGSADPVLEAHALVRAQDHELDEDAGVDANADGGDGDAHDAGASDADVTDIVELPPIPDADVPLLPPGLPH